MCRKFLKDFFNGKEYQICRPDEAIAYDTAIYAAMSPKKSEEVKIFYLSDVVSKSLGVKLHQSEMSRVIKRNSPILIQQAREYTTAYDNQTSADFQVYQGEANITEKNTYLGHFILDNIPPDLKVVQKVWSNI